MKLDRRLNLVIPVERGDGTTVYAHSAPISADIFDTYFLPIAKTFSAIYAEGLGPIAGPRVADKVLRKVAQEMGIWDTPGGVQHGLVAEIRRLTNVLLPGKNGWELLPYEDALKQKTIDQDDAHEIEAALTFFMVASAMHRRADLEAILNGAMNLWGARTELLSCTEFLNSLRTLSEVGNTGETAAG